MKKKLILGFLCLVLVLVLLMPAISGCTAPKDNTPTTGETPVKPVEVIEWVAQDVQPPNDPIGRSSQEQLADEVWKMSNGRLKITFHAANELVPNTELYDAVEKGTVDFAFNAGAYWRGQHPIFDVEYGLPFGPRDVADNRALFLDFGLLEIMQDYARENTNLYYLYPFVEGPLGLYSKVPITKPEDFQGLKVRTIGMFADVATLLGASVVSMPLTEVYTALATGVVDAGGVGTSFGGWGLRLQENTDYLLDPFASYAHSGGNYVVNKDSWDALPDDLKRIVEIATIYRCNYHINKDSVMRREIYKELEDAGKTITAFSDADANRVTPLIIEKIWDPIAAKGPWEKKAVDANKALLRARGIIQ